MRKPLPLAQTNAPLVLSLDASNETSTARNEQPYAIRTLICEVSNAGSKDTFIVHSSSKVTNLSHYAYAVWLLRLKDLYVLREHP